MSLLEAVEGVGASHGSASATAQALLERLADPDAGAAPLQPGTAGPGGSGAAPGSGPDAVSAAAVVVEMTDPGSATRTDRTTFAARPNEGVSDATASGGSSDRAGSEANAEAGRGRLALGQLASDQVLKRPPADGAPAQAARPALQSEPAPTGVATAPLAEALAVPVLLTALQPPALLQTERRRTPRQRERQDGAPDRSVGGAADPIPGEDAAADTAAHAPTSGDEAADDADEDMSLAADPEVAALHNLLHRHAQTHALDELARGRCILLVLPIGTSTEPRSEPRSELRGGVRGEVRGEVRDEVRGEVPTAARGALRGTLPLPTEPPNGLSTEPRPPRSQSRLPWTTVHAGPGAPSAVLAVLLSRRHLQRFNARWSPAGAPASGAGWARWRVFPMGDRLQPNTLHSRAGGTGCRIRLGASPLPVTPPAAPRNGPPVSAHASAAGAVLDVHERMRFNHALGGQWSLFVLAAPHVEPGC